MDDVRTALVTDEVLDRMVVAYTAAASNMDVADILEQYKATPEELDPERTAWQPNKVDMRKAMRAAVVAGLTFVEQDDQ